MIKVDGSYGEGGGQIVRYAGLYAVLTGKETEVFNIRVKRPNPGLRPQHLTFLKILKDAFKGEIDGLFIGSTQVRMKFTSIRSLHGKFKIGTAGSISLLLQSLIPPLLLSDSESNFTLVGGTDVKWSPPIDFMRSVYRAIVSKFGGRIEIHVERRGFYPHGGGIVRVTVFPSKLKGWIAKKRSLILDEIRVYNNVYKLPKHVLRRQRESVLRCLSRSGLRDINILDEYGQSTIDPGTSLVIAGFYSNNTLAGGGDSLGEKGKPAEKVAEEACTNFIKWFSSNATLDVHAGDMAIPLSVISGGTVEFSIPSLSSHIKSAIYVSKLFYEFNVTIHNYPSYILLSFR